MKSSFTPVVLGLIIINVAIHLVSLAMYDKISPIRNNYLVLSKGGTGDLLGLRDEGTRYGKFNVTQTLGSAFGHSIRHSHTNGQVVFQQSLFHILMNMMCLFFIGPAVERRMGSISFLIFYLFAAIVGGFITAFIDPALNPVLGASGAISGMLVAFAWLYPHAKLGLLFIPIHLPARVFTAIFAIFSLIMIILEVSGKSVLGGVSHFGHLAGMIAGFIFMLGYQLLGKTKSAV